ncbi:MAG TPA: carboxypeptidase-like regulatory domain-containing protein [Gemmataceae bacterium]|nr:carboxypeptidase-like regulatory domain-containing protein [Pirellulales bacterium]HZZ82766.1 carboxypeptidase-like regulatory domain-containing protein [Gemmataceae bacterium]
MRFADRVLLPVAHGGANGRAAIPLGYFIRLPAPAPLPIEIQTSGIVTLDGAPLTSASIGFMDANGTVRWTGTDATGGFSLPALPGSYKVRVAKRFANGPMRDAITGELIDPTKIRIGAVKPVELLSVIPENYDDPNASGFKADVRQGAANRFVFQLVTP